MTKQETIRIITLLQANYPDTYKAMSDKALEVVINLWQKSFSDDSFDTVYAAVFCYINAHTDRFAPNIGQIRQEIYKMTTTEGMTEAEAWSLVVKAAANSGYNSHEEFEKLPEIVRKVIGSPSTLREYGDMNSETFHSVIQSNFVRSYRTMQQRAAEDEKIPAAVKNYISTLTAPVLKAVEAPKPDKSTVIQEAREKIVAAHPPKMPKEQVEITEEARTAAIAKFKAALEERKE